MLKLQKLCIVILIMFSLAYNHLKIKITAFLLTWALYICRKSWSFFTKSAMFLQQPRIGWRCGVRTNGSSTYRSSCSGSSSVSNCIFRRQRNNGCSVIAQQCCFFLCNNNMVIVFSSALSCITCSICSDNSTCCSRAHSPVCGGNSCRSAVGPLKRVGAYSALSRRDNPILPAVSQTALQSPVGLLIKGFVCLKLMDLISFCGSLWRHVKASN